MVGGVCGRCHVTLVEGCGWLKHQIQNIQPKSGAEVNQLNCLRVVVNDIEREVPYHFDFFRSYSLTRNFRLHLSLLWKI